MQTLPYMGGYPHNVIGKSSSQPTTFGVIGMFHGDNKYQALQEKVVRPSHYKLPPLYSGNEHHMNSDRCILGHPSKTHIPNIHYGQVPFAGRFMTEHGHVEVYSANPHHDEYGRHGRMEHHEKMEHHSK